MYVLNPDVFVDAQVLEDAIKRDQGGGDEDIEDLRFNIGDFDIGDKGVVKDDVGNGTHEAAMKTAIVAPEASVDVDREDGR